MGGSAMTALKILGNFLKSYFLEIIIGVFGVALSITVACFTANYSWLIGIGETFFVELALFSIRKETKLSFDKYINDEMLHTIDELRLTQAELKAVSLTPLLAKKENQVAIQKEFDRIQETLLELQNGKRRIYENSSLYKEQQQIVMKSSKSLLAIHVVTRLDDLRRWDPKTMIKESQFYTVLYSTFAKKKKNTFKKQRIVILPKWKISEIKDKHSELVKENLLDLDKLSGDDRQLEEYYQIIERVVADQKDLGFQVRFITANEVLAAKFSHVYDCLIGDAKYGFEFSKSASADVRAYAINSNDYIAQQIKTFEELWNISKEW